MQKRLHFIFLFLFISTPLLAQKVDYISLVNRTSSPQLFFDRILLPAEDGKSSMSVIFRFDHDFLPFKKLPTNGDIKGPQNANFYTIARLSSEIFRGKAKSRDSNIQVVSRDLWIDTLYTETFAQTESRKLFASGHLTAELDPGQYYYVLQLSLMESSNDRNSNRQDFRIPAWSDKKTGEVIWIKNERKNETSSQFELMGMNDNVPFGKDFYALIRIPNYSSDSDYSVNISRASIQRNDTTSGKSVDNITISSEDIFTDVIPTISSRKNPTITIVPNSGSYTYAVIKIPNSNYQNDAYILELKSDKSDQILARSLFRSYWPDMPASLFNLDIALDMMKFIVDEDQLKKLKSGDRAEKERKFREFWENRDPTPNTVYNELMAEYFSRIDYAFKEFSNRGNMAGHESDQGEIYIKFGPPNEKKRQFPTSGAVIEIWEYKNRKFVFEATSGFGDFVLKGTESK